MTTLDYALAYIRRGWSVLPLKPHTKEPAVKIAPFLSGDFRITTEDAGGWWAQPAPGHTGFFGVAIVCGSPSGGLVVVDVDPRNGGDEARVLASFDYPPDLIVRTGSGGLHIYCALPSESINASCGKTALPGVDRKANGGYCVAPPSIHPNGTSYRWEPR